MTEIKLYKSPWKAIKIFALTIPFVIVGVWMITGVESDATQRIIGWISCLFFGLGIPVGLFHLLDRRPQIIINELGIFDRTTHHEFINWTLIEDAYLTQVHGQKFVCLVVAEQFEPSRKKGKLYKGVANLSRGMGFQELNIFLGQIKVNEIKLTEFIIALSKAKQSNRAELLKTLSDIG
jgi:hypothetical protein